MGEVKHNTRGTHSITIINRHSCPVFGRTTKPHALKMLTNSKNQQTGCALAAGCTKRDCVHEDCS